jgi:hypothetical protein
MKNKAKKIPAQKPRLWKSGRYCLGGLFSIAITLTPEGVINAIVPVGSGTTPGSTRVSRVGFGVSPKQSFNAPRRQGMTQEKPGKVRESETLSPTPETGALPGIRHSARGYRATCPFFTGLARVDFLSHQWRLRKNRLETRLAG